MKKTHNVYSAFLHFYINPSEKPLANRIPLGVYSSPLKAGDSIISVLQGIKNKKIESPLYEWIKHYELSEEHFLEIKKTSRDILSESLLSEFLDNKDSFVYGHTPRVSINLKLQLLDEEQKDAHLLMIIEIVRFTLDEPTASLKRIET